MVPISFENITRAASLDALSAYPVSASARATHESFESHLQRAAAPAIDPPARRPASKDEPREQSESTSNEPPRSEPVRQDTSETHPDDADARQSDAAEEKTADEASAERGDEVGQRDAAREDEAVIAAASQERTALNHEVELKVSADLEDNANKSAADRRAAASVAAEESELDASLEADAGESVDDEALAGRKVKRVNSEAAGIADSEPLARRVTPPDTSEEVVAGEFHDETEVAETTIPDDEPSKASKQPRRGSRSEIAATQTSREMPDDAAKPIAVDVAEATVDVASENGSRQRHSGRDTDVPQPVGNATAGESTTTTTGTPSRFAQHLLARTDDPSARGLNITNADQARFVDRVARAIQATGDRGGTLRLRLSPPELGALTLEVKVQGGVVSARVEADTPVARSLLLDNLPLLRERLAEYGMRVDQFDVDLSDRHADGTPDGLQQHDQQPEERPRANTTPTDSDDTSQATANVMPTKNGNEQLNIIV